VIPPQRLTDPFRHAAPPSPCGKHDREHVNGTARGGTDPQKREVSGCRRSQSYQGALPLRQPATRSDPNQKRLSEAQNHEIADADFSVANAPKCTSRVAETTQVPLLQREEVWRKRIGTCCRSSCRPCSAGEAVGRQPTGVAAEGTMWGSGLLTFTERHRVGVTSQEQLNATECHYKCGETPTTHGHILSNELARSTCNGYSTNQRLDVTTMPRPISSI
jgi:hypothetical protein